jgi:5-guanidino-2-oxopentanoate decarboxylase
MSGAPRTVGRYVAETLAANGIDTVFGIPGVHNIELYRGLTFTRLRHVLARHEQNAAFGADGYARAGGRPAAVFVISGPGVTNALTALAQAHSDSVPLLIIASTPQRATLGRHWGVLHELADQRALVAAVTPAARHAQRAAEVRDHLRAAFAALRAPRPRPAYLDIPLDLLAESTTLEPEVFATAAAAPPPAPGLLAQASARLEQAERPLVIAGGGARAAAAPLRALVEALDAYLVTTAAGKGLLPESHPANLGASLPYGPTQELIAAADVVIAVGTELSETDIYTTTRLPIPGTLIRIDVDPARLADQYAAEIPLQADAGECLQALTRGLRARAGWRSRAGGAGGHRERLEAAFDARARACAAVARAVRAAVPADGVVFSDMTQAAYTGNYAFAADRPGVWFHPSGYGTLGYALPAALGAKVAQPARAVVALAGDFGVQFTLQELPTAAELGLGLPLVVWNNQALAQIRDDMQAAGIPPLGVTARNPDFVALANACGAAAMRVRGPAALADGIRRALGARVPTLIEVHDTDFG